MQCKCGSSTVDREVIRDKQIEGEYMYCSSCGRVSWLRKSDKLKKELETEVNNY